MPAEPGFKRAVAFFDGQNLFHVARAVFGSTYPDYGIDVRIALDMVRLAMFDKYDVALLFCQDQDLAEAAAEVREICISQQRWIKVASAYPWSPHFPTCARRQRHGMGQDGGRDVRRMCRSPRLSSASVVIVAGP